MLSDVQRRVLPRQKTDRSRAQPAAIPARDSGDDVVNDLRKGFWNGIGAYASWGIFPLYWKLLSDVPVLQVISHRVLWSSVLLAGYVAVSGQAASLRESIRMRGVLGVYAVAAMLIGANWCLFVWAVGSGFVVETSLGYFINPLLSVLLGVFVLDEKLRPGQWTAVLLAASGVLYIAISHGDFPWISLTLATTFACYALVKKRAPLGSVHGLTIETGLLALPALAFLVWNEASGSGAFLHRPAQTNALLLCAGAVTTAPLLMFATAAQGIPMLWIGILQYIAPTLQLAIGVFVFHEPFSHEKLIGFSLVWAALALFAVEGIAAHRAAAVVPPPE
jgi:chloramphenicol-sensitive protein RarD